MNFVRIEDNRNNVVVKHKHLVLEARYRLSELGIKVVSMLISMIKINDDAFHQYALKVEYINKNLILLIQLKILVLD